MSGFGNIGTGLAGFMQGFQNSQQQAAQRALQQQALQQIQRALASSRLLGGSSLFGSGATPQPPMPGQASVPSFPQGGGGAPPMPAAPPAPPPVPQAPALPPAAAELLAGHDTYATPGQPQPASGDTPIPPPPMQGQQIDGSRPIMREELAPPPEPADAAAVPSATTAPTPSGSAGAGGEALPAPAAGGSPANSSLFQQLLDPNHAYKALGEMRDRIAASAPPGTDPAVIWEATQQLYKLTNGGQAERAQLAAYLKLAGIDGAAQRQDKALAVRQGEGAANRDAAGARQNKSLAATGARQEAREKAIDARSADRAAAQRQRDALNRGDKQTAQKLAAIRAQISAQAQIIANSPAGSSAQKAAQLKLQELSTQAEQMGPSGTVAPPAAATSPAPSQ